MSDSEAIECDRRISELDWTSFAGWWQFQKDSHAYTQRVDELGYQRRSKVERSAMARANKEAAKLREEIARYDEDICINQADESAYGRDARASVAQTLVRSVLAKRKELKRLEGKIATCSKKLDDLRLLITGCQETADTHTQASAMEDMSPAQMAEIAERRSRAAASIAETYERRTEARALLDEDALEAHQDVSETVANVDSVETYGVTNEVEAYLAAMRPSKKAAVPTRSTVASARVSSVTQGR